MHLSHINELEIVSTLDGAIEKSLFHYPEKKEKVPLLVGLHTWSYDRFNQVEQMLPLCRDRGWALLLPEFRGPNLTSNPRAPQACGSALARQDILDALDTVTAWVPITDLAAWHGENPEYASHVAACCGGEPGSGEGVDREYRERSPLSYIKELSTVNLSVHHGRHDPLVHFSHSWRLAQELEKQGAERFFFEIFDGGHDIHYERAFSWFDRLAGSGKEAGVVLSG